VLTDRENGLVVDFFSIDQICDRVDEVLDSPSRMEAIRNAARTTAITDFDTNAVTLPRWDRLLYTLADGQLPVAQPPDQGVATQVSLR